MAHDPTEAANGLTPRHIALFKRHGNSRVWIAAPAPLLVMPILPGLQG